MSRTRVEINESGFDAYRSSGAMASLVEGFASDIATRAGDGYNYDVLFVETRVIASAYTETYDAMLDQAKNNTLLKAVSG